MSKLTEAFLLTSVYIFIHLISSITLGKQLLGVRSIIGQIVYVSEVYKNFPNHSTDVYSV